MATFWALLKHLHSLAGPAITLLFPLYSSICAIENKSNREEDEQWLAYWILYSFLTLFEMVAEPILYWIPFWHTVKMVFVAWLVLPQLRGASFVYEELVKGKLKKYFRNLGSDRLHEQKAED
ncbi:protein HVA22-like [Zingiber officinale]|uniref:protein HVA22-like n=1 Tax=Zingiber officinale TaxID=94328 RepID=UPI001C4CD5CA|nr:protein HVA22-like [Zingiber officinale]